MDEDPPRRSKRPSNKRSKASSFPLVPFLIGVIVLGFVIGAGLSMAGRHGSPGDRVADVAASAEPSPTYAPPTLAPLATHRPVAAATDIPDAATDAPGSPGTASPKPRRTPTPAPSPKRTESAHVSLASLPPASATPTHAAATALATLLPAPVTPVPLHSHAPAAIAKIVPPVIVSKTSAPTSVPTTAPTSTERPATQAPAQTTVDADSDFGRLSASVVRQYLRALARGDTESAYGAFGVSAGSSGVSFPERPIMESAAQIGAISARGSSDAQTVNVTISTANGSYNATYAVHRTPTGAAVIVSHSINKG